MKYNAPHIKRFIKVVYYKNVETKFKLFQMVLTNLKIKVRDCPQRIRLFSYLLIIQLYLFVQDL